MGFSRETRLSTFFATIESIAAVAVQNHAREAFRLWFGKNIAGHKARTEMALGLNTHSRHCITGL